MKIILHLLICFLFFISINLQAQSVREKISFDEGWKFHLGNAADPSKDFNYGSTNIFSKAGEAGNTCINPYFNDASWRNVDLPHDWAVELPFEQSKNFDMDSHGYKAIGAAHPENSIGWYRKTFSVSPKDSGNKYVLQFDGVYRDCKVFINGHYLGGNFSGYMGFELDVTDYLNFRTKNVITVRVDATQFEGWFYEGAGIYRHVWLHKMHPLHIASNGTYIQTKINNKNAAIIVETKLQNQLYHQTAAEILSYVIDKSGNKVALFVNQKAQLQVNEIKSLHQIVNIIAPHLWSVDDPYLYKLVSVVKSNGKTIDSVVTKFGIRSIVVDKDKGLFVNGKFVKILGTCNHQDHAGVGAAVPDALQYYRIKLLKEMGDNAYRTSHNPPTPELLDACDELGMLVLDENRLLGSSSEIMNQFERLILRDRNHPSVFMWSLANEEHGLQYTDVAKRIGLTLLAKQKELDPSRTSTYAADMGNVRRGINEIIPVRGFNYNLAGIDHYRKENPNQPIIGTEVASTVCTRGIYVNDSTKGYVPDYDSIYPPWASRAETWWKLAAAREWFMGGFVWTGFDYRGEPTPFTWPCINSHFGVMDVCGFPKNDYYYYQSWWSNKDVLHIFPHWNWSAKTAAEKGKEGEPIRVDVNSNAETVELFLNDKSLGKQTMPLNGHLSWNVIYQPGKLTAVATKHGRTFSSFVETTDEAYQIVATPDRTILAADGKDVTVINISVQDKKGREVPDAMNLLHFAISNANIIGVGNGDPSSHEADKFLDGKYQRSLFNGKCQVIIQTEKNKTDIIFEAKGEGLMSSKTVLKAE
jgi:beta-galactosidase